MNNKDFNHLVNDVLGKCRDILVKKGHDYASDSDRLSNFNHVATMTGLGSPADICYTLQCVKRARLDELIGAGKHPNNESIYDSYIDLINYVILEIACRVEQNELRLPTEGRISTGPYGVSMGGGGSTDVTQRTFFATPTEVTSCASGGSSTEPKKRQPKQ